MADEQKCHKEKNRTCRLENKRDSNIKKISLTKIDIFPKYKKARERRMT